MPIYEYACGECGHRLEIIQRMSADPVTQCPKCCQDTLRKLVSAAGFRLKGGGWYETDFKGGAKKPASESSSSSSHSCGSGGCSTCS